MLLTSGRATIQGYIDAANDMLPQVESAYQALARAASNALGAPAYSNSAYAANGNNRGYATGTDNAAPGFALVYSRALRFAGRKFQQPAVAYK